MPAKKIITPGERFGLWKVLAEDRDRVTPGGRPIRHVLCVCDCGVQKTVSLQNLTSGLSKSCGCEVPITPGKRFGRLTVVKELPRHTTSGGNVQRQFFCRCDCGEERSVVAGALRNGRQSCGCLAFESTRKRSTKHGYAGTKLYLVWNNMWRRCTEPTNDRYAQYGGRGIRVCDRWEKFENFLADMGEPPAGMSIDRYPNNDGNYEPDNCRWASAKEQANNKRCSRPVTIDGVTRPITDWIKVVGISKTVLYRRMRIGLDPAEAIVSLSAARTKPPTE